MATSHSQQGSRCLFLELPSEIRVIIYEEVAQQQPASNMLALREFHGSVTREHAHHLALARVNRQIRQEPAPIVYRNLTIQVTVSSHTASRVRVRQWAERVDPNLVSAIQKSTLAPRHMCSCSIFFSLADLKRPVRFHTNCRYIRRCFTKMNASLVEDMVLALVTVGGKRRVMTKEVLGRLVRLF